MISFKKISLGLAGTHSYMADLRILVPSPPLASPLGSLAQETQTVLKRLLAQETLLPRLTVEDAPDRSCEDLLPADFHHD